MWAKRGGRRSRWLAGLLVAVVGAVPCWGQQTGTISLVPVGVVGGNPPGTVINGSSITLAHGGAVVEFEVRATWTGLADSVFAGVDCDAGCSNGVGAPLSLLHRDVVPSHGAYVSYRVCLNNGRAGCDPANGQPACDESIEGPCVPNSRYVFADDPNPLIRVWFETGFGIALFENVGHNPVLNTGNYAGTVLVDVPPSALGSYDLALRLATHSTNFATFIGRLGTLFPIQITSGRVTVLANPCAGIACASAGDVCMVNRPTVLADGTCVCAVGPQVGETPCPGDENSCTRDVCLDGVCEHPPVTCSEGQSCDPWTGLCQGPLGAARTSMVPVGIVGGGDCEIRDDRMILYETDVLVELEAQVVWTGLLGVAQASVSCPRDCGNGVGVPITFLEWHGGVPQPVYLNTQTCLYSQRPGCPATGQPPSGEPPCDAHDADDGPCADNPRFIFAAANPPAWVAQAWIPGRTCEISVLSPRSGSGASFSGINDYVGTMLVHVPQDAAGVYEIPLDANETYTFVGNEHAIGIPITRVPAIIEIFDPCRETICTPSRSECRETVRSKVDGRTCACVEQAVANGTPCADDGLAGTIDRCFAGVCRHLMAPEVGAEAELTNPRGH